MTISKTERDKEIDELADWCELVTHFIFGDCDPEMLDLAQSGTRKARERRDLRGLRMVYRDLNESIRDLSGQPKADLDAILIARFGHGIERGKQMLERQARKILQSGKIRKADEYRILESWLETLLSDPSKTAEIERINALLMSVTAPLPE